MLKIQVSRSKNRTGQPRVQLQWCSRGEVTAWQQRSATKPWTAEEIAIFVNQQLVRDNLSHSKKQPRERVIDLEE